MCNTTSLDQKGEYGFFLSSPTSTLPNHNPPNPTQPPSIVSTARKPYWLSSPAGSFSPRPK